MSDAIRVRVVPDSLQVLPNGDAVEAVVTVQNTGVAVDQYAVELDGLPTTWYTLSTASVALFPQDKDEARLVIRPPKGNGARAGFYPFNVVVVSRADASQTSRAEATLQIGTVETFEVDMSPRKVIGRRGRYNLTMRNGGNTDLDVALEGGDAEELCRYTFTPATLQLSAGQMAAVALLVRPRRSGWIGAAKTIDFQVKVKRGQGDPKTVPGQLIHTPRLRSWKPIRRLLILILLLALAAIGINAAGGPSGLQTQWNRTAAPAICHRLQFACTLLNQAQRRPHLTPPAHQATYTYLGEFRDFYRHAPRLVGRPISREHVTGPGFATQRTTHGVLIYDGLMNHSYFVSRDLTVYEYDQATVHHRRGVVRKL